MSVLKRVVIALAGVAMVSVPGAALIHSSSTTTHRQALVCDDFLYDNFRVVQVVCDNYQGAHRL